MQIVQHVLEIADARLAAIFGFEPTPIHCATKAQFGRSVLMADIEEAQAELAALISLEQAQRVHLQDFLGALATAAECAKYRIEQGQWTSAGREVADAMARVQSARLKQEFALDTITSKQAALAAMQSKLNDADYWKGVR
jgi:hypothetical protein